MCGTSDFRIQKQDEKRILEDEEILLRLAEIFLSRGMITPEEKVRMEALIERGEDSV